MPNFFQGKFGEKSKKGKKKAQVKRSEDDRIFSELEYGDDPVMFFGIRQVEREESKRINAKYEEEDKKEILKYRIAEAILLRQGNDDALKVLRHQFANRNKSGDAEESYQEREERRKNEISQAIKLRGLADIRKVGTEVLKTRGFDPELYESKDALREELADYSSNERSLNAMKADYQTKLDEYNEQMKDYKKNKKKRKKGEAEPEMPVRPEEPDFYEANNDMFAYTYQEFERAKKEREAAILMAMNGQNGDKEDKQEDKQEDKKEDKKENIKNDGLFSDTVISFKALINGEGDTIEELLDTLIELESDVDGYSGEDKEAQGQYKEMINAFKLVYTGDKDKMVRNIDDLIMKEDDFKKKEIKQLFSNEKLGEDYLKMDDKERLDFLSSNKINFKVLLMYVVNVAKNEKLTEFFKSLLVDKMPDGK